MWGIVAVVFVMLLATNDITYEKADTDGDDSTLNFSAGVSWVSQDYSFENQAICEIEADIISADILVSPGDTDEITVTLSGSGWNMENVPSVSLKDEKLTLKSPEEHDEMKDGNRYIKIKIPPSAVYGLRKAVIKTITGDIVTEDIPYDMLSANSSSGNVTIDGNIKQVFANTVSGNITASGSFNGITGNSVSGRIKVKNSKPITEDCMFGTVSSDIEITLPASSSFECAWESLSGSMENGFCKERCDKSGSVSIGSNGPNLHFATVSGDLSVIKN